MISNFFSNFKSNLKIKLLSKKLIQVKYMRVYPYLHLMYQKIT